MTSFGFSIGDVALACKYASSVYKSCKNAGDNFREITADVDSLQSVLNTLDTECKSPTSSFRYLPSDQQGQLAARLQACESDLRSVETILRNFRSLDTDHARSRDKLGFTSGKQTAIRQKIVAHSARLQLFLIGQNSATLSRIERNTEILLLSLNVPSNGIRKNISSRRRNAPSHALSGDLLALEDKTQGKKLITSGQHNVPTLALSGDGLASKKRHLKAIPFVRPNASDRATSGGALSSRKNTLKNSTIKNSSLEKDTPKNSIPKFRTLTNPTSNKTMKEVDFDTSSAVGEWHDEGSKENLRPAKKRNSPSRHSQVNTDVSRKNIKSSPSLENAKKATSDPTVALVKHDANQLISLKGFPTFEEAYHHHEKKMECMRTEDWSNLSPVENTFYILRFSYEELCSGTSRRINVRRRTRSKKTPSEHLSLKVKVEKGYTDVYGLQFIGAGNQCAGYTKNLVFAVTCKKHKLFSRHQSNLAHGVSISVAEAINGWRREIRHPSGIMIELHAYGPTNVRHFLEMYNYGLPYRHSPEAHGSLLLWIQVTDIEDASVGQLDQLEFEGGTYFARIKGEEGRRFESTQEEAVDLQAFGDKATSHSKLLSAGFKKRMNDVEKSPRRKVTPTEGKKRLRSPSHLS